ncbi:MAG: Xaa-Pro peptidase family protein [Cytophagaceae bacterium]|jgi:Xaa-Pro aminopeptidase|nr:Xaa-Pro peptidase family protein [Cytophagaceae bacterium]
MNSVISAELKLRRKRLQQAIRESEMDACLLSDTTNICYVAGMVFSGYAYIPADGEPLFFVKRPTGLLDENIIYIRKPEQMADFLAQRGVKMPNRLLLEGDELTFNEYVRIQAVFNPQKTGNATALMRSVRSIKTDYEISQFRISAQKQTMTYTAIKSCYKTGMTDVDFQIEIEYLMRKNGSLGIFRTFGANMDIYMGSILAGDNAQAASPFDFALGGAGQDVTLPIGANGTVLKEGTAVMVDMAGNYTPYITDMTRVFAVGKLTDKAYRAHEVAVQIQNEIEKAAHPGVCCADLYNLALKIVEKENLSDCFMGTKQQAKFVGHGIGLQINELPVLTGRSNEILQPNMVFALEPKFVIPKVGAVGIENSFRVTENGLEKLTVFEEAIIELT